MCIYHLLNLDIKQKPDGGTITAWYDDKNKLTYVATYKNEKDAAKEANKAAKKGWMPQSTTATDGHINLGRTITYGVLTLGVSYLLGGSRTKGTITISYVRTPEWLAEHNKVKLVSDSPILPSSFSDTASPSSPSLASVASSDDPIQALQKLKSMLDSGLITEEEYNTKKANILSRM
jgi:hypothetical protein